MCFFSNRLGIEVVMDLKDRNLMIKLDSLVVIT